MRYFDCDESVSRNCKRFADSFKNSVGIDFVDSFGNIFYKLADGNTRFVSLDDRIGMYIETKDATMIPLVIKNVQFVTTEWAKKIFASKATSICVSPEVNLRSVSTIRTLIYDGELSVEVIGPSTTENTITCLIAIDPNNTL